MSDNSVDEVHYWHKMWMSFLSKAAHIIVSRRIVFDERAKKGKIRNTKSFHFPNVAEFVEVMSSIRKATRDVEELTDQVYFLDIYIDEVFEVKPDTNRARGTGLLSRKMASQTKRYVKRYLLERWSIKKSNKRTGMSHTLNKMIYQKATILMRSLYSFLLLLPCYKFYRRSQRNRRTMMKLKYKFYRFGGVSKHENEVDTIINELHQKYSFSPILTSVCQMNISVEYSKDFRLNPQEQPLIDSGLIRKDTLSEFEENSGEVEEETSGPVSSFDPENEDDDGHPIGPSHHKSGSPNTSDLRYPGPSPSRPVPKQRRGSQRDNNNHKGDNQRYSQRRRSSQHHQQQAGSVPTSRRRPSSYRSGTSGTSYEEEMIGSPPFARFVGSIEKHPHSLFGRSFEERVPFGILRKPSMDSGTPGKLPFSPFNSPPVAESFNSYSTTTSEQLLSMTPTPPKSRYSMQNQQIDLNNNNNNNNNKQRRRSSGKDHQKKRRGSIKSEKSTPSQFTPPDPTYEDFKERSRKVQEEGGQGGQGRAGQLQILRPLIMDIERAGSRTPDTPKDFSGDEGNVMPFVDDDDAREVSGEEKSLYHELVGDLLNKIENAPILAAFYDDNGSTKRENLQDVLNTLTKLERGKKKMMMVQ